MPEMVSPGGPLLRVLVIEDNPERQEILTRLYRNHAWVLAHTGRRAVTLLQAYRFDLVSLDYHLAGDLTGADVAQALLATRNSAARLVIHSMNPAGAAEIARLLPGAVVFPISKMIKSNRTFNTLCRGIDTLGVDFGWTLAEVT